MAVDPLLERSFGQTKVLFLITLCADRCLGNEQPHQAFSTKWAFILLAAVAMAFLVSAGERRLSLFMVHDGCATS